MLSRSKCQEQRPIGKACATWVLEKRTFLIVSVAARMDKFGSPGSRERTLTVPHVQICLARHRLTHTRRPMTAGEANYKGALRSACTSPTQPLCNISTNPHPQIPLPNMHHPKAIPTPLRSQRPAIHDVELRECAATLAMLATLSSTRCPLLQTVLAIDLKG